MSKIEIEFSDNSFFNLEKISKKSQVIYFDKEKFMLFIEDLFNIQRDYNNPEVFSRLKKGSKSFYNTYSHSEYNNNEYPYQLKIKTEANQREISSPILSVIENEDYLKVLLPKNIYRNLAFSFVYDKKNDVSYSIQNDLFNIISKEENILVTPFGKTYRIVFKENEKFISHFESSIAHQFSADIEINNAFKYITNIKKIDAETYKVDLRHCQFSNIVIKNNVVESFKLNEQVLNMVKKDSCFRDKKDLIEKISNYTEVEKVNSEFKDYLELKLLITDNQESVDFLSEQKIMKIFSDSTQFKYEIKEYTNFSKIYEKIYEELTFALVESDEIFINREKPVLEEYKGNFIKNILIQQKVPKEYFKEFTIENLRKLKLLITKDSDFNKNDKENKKTLKM